MTSRRSLTLSWVALGFSIVFLSGAIVYRLTHRAGSPVKLAPAAAMKKEPSPTGPPSKRAQPRTSQGQTAFEIAETLSNLRRHAQERRQSGVAATSAELAEAAREERNASELASRLAKDFRDHPESWSDVADLLSDLEDLKAATSIASCLGAGGTAASEVFWGERLGRGEGSARGRLVAASALSGGTSTQGLQSLVRASESDADASVRLAAATGLAQRRLGADPGVQASIETALRRRATSDSDGHVRQVCLNLVEPHPPSAGPADPARSRSLTGSADLK